ncbi:MAG: hypothetical protein ACMXYB_00440 [Candidatus Woesearchaeota archaeon]
MNRNNKWIFSRHTRDIDTLIYIAKYLQTHKGIIENEERLKLISHLKKEGIYNERFDTLNISTLMNKISDLNFYLFGYKEKVDGELKFLFSPLANLLNMRMIPIKNKKYFLQCCGGFNFLILIIKQMKDLIFIHSD